MTPAAIIQGAQSDGVRLALSPAGTIKATGDGTAVNRWLAVIREHKAAIIETLKVGAGDTAASREISLPGELERLIGIVGRTYDTPAEEYPLIREAASRDTEGALQSFSAMAEALNNGD